MFIGLILKKRYMNNKENSTKIYAFSVLVRCNQDSEDVSISVDGEVGVVPLYKFDDSGWFYYRYCKSKKTRDYIFHRAMLRKIKLISSSIISNVTITIFSKYNTMTSNCRLH